MPRGSLLRNTTKMTLKIRLVKIGKKGKKIYRIVVAPTRSKQKGASLDFLGTYDFDSHPPLVKIDQGKFQKWIKNGAQISDGLRRIIKNTPS